LVASTWRIALLVLCLIAGAFAGPGFASGDLAWLVGAAGGATVFAGVLLVEGALRQTPPHIGLGGGLGALAGLLAALWARQVFLLDALPKAVSVACGGVLVYLGALLGAKGIRVAKGATTKAAVTASASPKILDTSAIIDGRIADMVDLGFIGGPIVVPQFVLNEVQGVADSTDPLKRARGRRGLGILERLQGLEGVEVRITDQDFPRVKEVDSKIVALAKATGATVVTNDFNLTKVAELQGVRVLNIHQLAHALRPVVLPGENVQVTLQKEGKEPGQGIGYLEDGTMVVVEGGASRLGQSVKGVVTSVLQTTAGRMIFARPDEAGADSGPLPERRRVWRRNG